MNNEPVAWIDKDTLDATHIIKAVVRREQDEQHNIPLYTHPVKQLTDGEIQEISHQYHYTYNPDYVGFAREILRKAQEK